MSPSEEPRPRRRAWNRLALLAGIAYFLIGKGFALPTSHARAWRLTAWLVSAVVFASQVGYEHFRLRSSPRVTAWHSALAVAIGAFLLALAGIIHSLSITPTIRPTWLLALVAWPLVTAVPAFLVALAVCTVLARWRPGE